jgi:hypothetical protein
MELRLEINDIAIHIKTFDRWRWNHAYGDYASLFGAWPDGHQPVCHTFSGRGVWLIGLAVWAIDDSRADSGWICAGDRSRESMQSMRSLQRVPAGHHDTSPAYGLLLAIWTPGDSTDATGRCSYYAACESRAADLLPDFVETDSSDGLSTLDNDRSRDRFSRHSDEAVHDLSVAGAAAAYRLVRSVV